jgi:hypothetical protein
MSSGESSELGCRPVRRVVTSGAGIVAVVVGGCGGGFDPTANQAKTRFAIAQLIELKSVGAFGPYVGANALSTLCASQSKRSWHCLGVYTPRSGVIRSVDQVVADTDVAYDAGHHVFQFSPATTSISGRGITATVSLTNLASVAHDDGSQVGAVNTSSAGSALQPTAVTKLRVERTESESTVDTIAPLLTKASRAELERARKQAAASVSGSAPSQTQTSPPPTSPAPDPHAYETSCTVIAEGGTWNLQNGTCAGMGAILDYFLGKTRSCAQTSSTLVQCTYSGQVTVSATKG